MAKTAQIISMTILMMAPQPDHESRRGQKSGHPNRRRCPSTSCRHPRSSSHKPSGRAHWDRHPRESRTPQSQYPFTALAISVDQYHLRLLFSVSSNPNRQFRGAGQVNHVLTAPDSLSQKKTTAVSAAMVSSGCAIPRRVTPGPSSLRCGAAMAFCEGRRSDRHRRYRASASRTGRASQTAN